MLKHSDPCHDTDTHTSLDAAKSEVDLRASHDLYLRLFRGGRALHSAVRGRAVRMGHEQDENSTLSSIHYVPKRRIDELIINNS